MFTTALYFSAVVLLLISFFKNKQKTRMALKKSWKAFENILLQFLSILLSIGITLAILSPQIINKFIGDQSGWIGMSVAAIIGSVTLIPGFVAFPLTAALYENGAGLMQIVVFISTLMAVGIVTFPVEIKFFGRTEAIFDCFSETRRYVRGQINEPGKSSPKIILSDDFFFIRKI